MQKWEYKNISDPSEKLLNMLGAEGWELVAVIINPNNAWISFYFKRPK
ncbi:MAG: hypothetical protein QOH63_3802 [Acidobacteriota bacterium]|jgi:hypothetical protein|nr:hypothetical protein [Acidobacteriota bacterium]